MTDDVRVVRAEFARPEHARAVVSLLDQYARDPMGAGGPLSDRAREELCPALARRPGSHAVLAFDGERAVGLLIAFESFSTFACQPVLNLHDIVVASSHRLRGICTRMLREAESLARELGCCKLTLEVLAGNRVAKAAYRNFGFTDFELDPAHGAALFWQKKM